MKLLFASLLIALCSGCTPKQKEKHAVSPLRQNDIVVNSTIKVQKKTATDEYEEDIDEFEFGFSDSTGKKIKLLEIGKPNPKSDDPYDELPMTNLKRFKLVITNNQPAVAVKYLHMNVPVGLDNADIQNYAHFNNTQGYLFKAQQPIGSNNRAVVVVSDTFLKHRKQLVSIKNSSDELPDSIRTRIEAEQKREVKNYKKVAQLEGGKSIYLVAFHPKGKELLAVLALVTPKKIIYEKYTGTADETDGKWPSNNFYFDGFALIGVFEHNAKIGIVYEWIDMNNDDTSYVAFMEELNQGWFMTVKCDFRHLDHYEEQCRL